MEKVVDVLSRKYPQFNTVVSFSLVSDALYQMCCENVDYLIVMEEGRFQGIITDHDIAGKILFENRPLNRIHVSEFMSRSLPVATPDASIEYCMQLMERYNVKHIAVFERFDFRGIVSSKDLMQEAFANKNGGLAGAEKASAGYPWNY